MPLNRHMIIAIGAKVGSCSPRGGALSGQASAAWAIQGGNPPVGILSDRMPFPLWYTSSRTPRPCGRGPSREGSSCPPCGRCRRARSLQTGERWCMCRSYRCGRLVPRAFPPVAPVVGGVVSNTFPRLCGDVSGGIQYLDVRALWGASRMQRRITKEGPHVRCLTVAVGTTNRAETSRPRSPRWLTRSSPRLHAMYSTDLTPAPCLLRRRCSVGTTAIPHGAPLGTS